MRLYGPLRGAGPTLGVAPRVAPAVKQPLIMLHRRPLVGTRLGAGVDHCPLAGAVEVVQLVGRGAGGGAAGRTMSRDNPALTALIVAVLALMWLGAFVESQ